MLDVGAGNGAFMVEAIKRSSRLKIYGAEYSQAAIDLASPRLKERLARCDLQGDQPLPWGGGFQVITCMEVLEHLPDDELRSRTSHTHFPRRPPVHFRSRLAIEMGAARYRGRPRPTL